MTKAELNKKMAYLEFVNDQLETEISHTNELLKRLGFARGLASAIEIAEELLQNGPESFQD